MRRGMRGAEGTASMETDLCKGWALHPASLRSSVCTAVHASGTMADPMSTKIAWEENTLKLISTVLMGLFVLAPLITGGCMLPAGGGGTAAHTFTVSGHVDSSDPAASPDWLILYIPCLEVHLKTDLTDGAFEFRVTTSAGTGYVDAEFYAEGHHPAVKTIRRSDAVYDVQLSAAATVDVSGSLDYALPQAAGTGALSAAAPEQLRQSREPTEEPDSILVRTDNTRRDKDTIANQFPEAGVVYRKHLDLLEIRPLQTDQVREIYDTLRKNPAVKWIRPNERIYATDMVVPNDPKFDQQWHLPAVYLPYAWKLTTGTRTPPLSFGIMDTLADKHHPDLSGQIREQIPLLGSTAPEHHGTHVAGIIGAATDNREGVAGTIWHNRMYSYGVLSDTLGGSDASLAEGIGQAADLGVDIINMSLGGTSPLEATKEELEKADAKGILLIAAAGNKPAPDRHTTFYPAAYSEVLAVGAVEAGSDGSLKVADYSLLGSDSDPVVLFAPGGSRSGPGILSTTIQELGYYTTDAGTSMAAPLAAGIAGLVLSREPTLSPDAVVQRLYDTGISLTFDGHDRRLINAYAAVAGSYLRDTRIRFTAQEGEYQGLSYWATIKGRQFSAVIPPGTYSLTAVLPVEGGPNWTMERTAIVQDGKTLDIKLDI